MPFKEVKKAMGQSRLVQWFCCQWIAEFYAGLFSPTKIVISSRTTEKTLFLFPLYFYYFERTVRAV